MLLTPGAQRPGVLLNTLRCAGHARGRVVLPRVSLSEPGRRNPASTGKVKAATRWTYISEQVLKEEVLTGEEGC